MNDDKMTIQKALDCAKYFDPNLGCNERMAVEALKILAQEYNRNKKRLQYVDSWKPHGEIKQHYYDCMCADGAEENYCNCEDKSMKGLQMKYFILNPSKNNAYGEASRKAMIAYAVSIKQENSALSDDLIAWVDRISKCDVKF